MTGLTGAPGAGKSTLVDGLVGFAAARGNVAVVAVDPSSPFSGGAVLGDRIRMQRHTDDPRIYIRSMANRGHLGGLADSTPRVVALLDGIGFAEVLIETVGVGQAEVQLLSQIGTPIDDPKMCYISLLSEGDFAGVRKEATAVADEMLADIKKVSEDIILGRVKTF